MSPASQGTLSALDISRLLGQAYPPTDEQRAVIEAPLTPQLVVAGAGSGKTETMSARVVWLIANGLAQPRDILGLTFTRKAAFELNERIGHRLAQLATVMRENGIALPPGLERSHTDIVGQRPHVHTYNGFALDLVKEHALRIGVDPEFTVLTPAAAWQLAFDIVDGYSGTLPFTQKSATIASAVVSLSGSLADHLATTADFDDYLRDIEVTTMNLPLQDDGGKRRTAPKDVKKLWESLEQRRALVPLLVEFAERKRELGAIDFADQVAYAARIAREAPAVATAVRSQYPVVLLDEFQDTSVSQLVFLERLFGNGHATCAVGDPNQAIYGWRGASAASLSHYAVTFGTPEAPVREYSLSSSFRNDELVLAAANAVGTLLERDDSPVTLPVLRARRGAGPGAITCTRYPDTRSEADGIAAWIAHERGAALAAWDGEGLDSPPPPSAAILTRTRGMVPALTDALDAAGLPYHVVGGGGLLHEPEVADVRALLEVADASDRGDSLMRLLEGPRFRLGTRDIAVLGRWRDRLQQLNPEARERGDSAAYVTLADAIEQPPPADWIDREGRSLSDEGRERLQDLRECVREVRAHAALDLSDLVSLAVRTLGVDLAVLADSRRDPSRALRNLDEFRGHAASYAATARTPGLTAFLAFLDVTAEKEAGLSAADDVEVPDDAVIVSTMHASKGLEWDLVAIAGLADGTFPSYTRSSAKETDHQGLPRPKERGWLDSVALASIPTELRGDSDILDELRWAEADTQVELEERIAEFRYANGDEKIREETRLMYVAITRAKKALHLSWAPWREESATASSRSRFLMPLDHIPGVEQRTEGEVPEENPLVSAPRRASWPEPVGPREAAVADAVARTSGTQPSATDDASPFPMLDAATDHVIAAHRAGLLARDVHLPLRLSPSELVALSNDDGNRLRDIVRPMPRRPSAHAALGTRFHTWLETTSAAPPLIDIDEFDGLTQGDDADERVDSSELASLHSKFERSRFASMTPIAVEQPVSLALAGAFMPGVIDAVYRDPDDPEGVWIVDWKTGRVPHGTDLARKGLQLSVYRLAWHQHTGVPLERIRTFFHYVAAEKTLEISEHASASELEQLLGGIEGD